MACVCFPHTDFIFFRFHYLYDFLIPHNFFLGLFRFWDEINQKKGYFLRRDIYLYAKLSIFFPFRQNPACANQRPFSWVASRDQSIFSNYWEVQGEQTNETQERNPCNLIGYHRDVFNLSKSKIQLGV